MNVYTPAEAVEAIAACGRVSRDDAEAIVDSLILAGPEIEPDDLGYLFTDEEIDLGIDQANSGGAR